MRGLGVDRQPTALGNFLDVGVAARPAAQAGLASAFQILGATYLMRTRARKGAEPRFACSSGCYNDQNCRQRPPDAAGAGAPGGAAGAKRQMAGGWGRV